MNQVIIFIKIIVNIYNKYHGWQKPGLYRKKPNTFYGNIANNY